MRPWASVVMSACDAPVISGVSSGAAAINGKSVCPRIWLPPSQKIVGSGCPCAVRGAARTAQRLPVNGVKASGERSRFSASASDLSNADTVSGVRSFAGNPRINCAPSRGKRTALTGRPLCAAVSRSSWVIGSVGVGVMVGVADGVHVAEGVHVGVNVGTTDGSETTVSVGVSVGGTDVGVSAGRVGVSVGGGSVGVSVGSVGVSVAATGSGVLVATTTTGVSVAGTATVSVGTTATTALVGVLIGALVDAVVGVLVGVKVG